MIRPGQGLPTLFVEPEEIVEAQNALLGSMLDIVAERHPYYRSLFAASGVDVGLVRTIDDLTEVQLTTKSDFVVDPESFRLDPEEGDELWDVIYTTGSTSRPSPIYQTAYDFRAILFAQRRMAEIRGLSPDDRIMNLFPLAQHPTGAWLRVNHGAHILGAAVVNGLSGPATAAFSMSRRLTEVADLVVRTQPTILWGIPSYVERLIAEIAGRGGRLPSVRLVVGSGETLSEKAEAALLDSLAELGAQAELSRGFGASEMQISLIECSPGSGLHNPAPELFHVQAVDDDGRPVPDGEPGAFCLTHLDRRGTVLVRYLLGDIVEFDNSRCGRCGRSGGRLTAHHGRRDDFFKVRGNLVNPQQLLHAIQSVDGVQEYQALISRGSASDVEELIIRVAGMSGVDEEDLIARLTSEVRAKIGLRPSVEVRPLEEIYRPDDQLKPVRIKHETRHT